MTMLNLELNKLAGVSAILLLAMTIGACTAGDDPLDLPENYEPVTEPEIDAATIDPCANDFAFQRELNGVPDDTAVETSNAAGKSLITEMYWYADTSMIVNFRYADGEAWCNVWNENGVSWER